MIVRHLILSFVLLTNTLFVQRAPLTSGSALAQPATRNSSGFDRTYKLTFRNAVQDKNFYLLSLFQRHRAVRRLLSENEAMKELFDEKLQASGMAAHCDDVGCVDKSFRFSGEHLEMVATELEGLAKRPEFKTLIIDMRRSGAFIKYSNQSDTEMLIAAWKDAANGMNRLLGGYRLGHDPTYKEIDKVSFDVSSEAYRKLLKAKIAEISKEGLY